MNIPADANLRKYTAEFTSTLKNQIPQQDDKFKTPINHYKFGSNVSVTPENGINGKIADNIQHQFLPVKSITLTPTPQVPKSIINTNNTYDEVFNFTKDLENLEVNSFIHVNYPKIEKTGNLQYDQQQ